MLISCSQQHLFRSQYNIILEHIVYRHDVVNCWAYWIFETTDKVIQIIVKWFNAITDASMICHRFKTHVTKESTYLSTFCKNIFWYFNN